MSDAPTAWSRVSSEPHVLRLGLVASLILGVTVAHYLTPPSFLLLHNVYQRLYYIPLLLACAWFGLRGGIAAAVVTAILYAPHILLQWAHMRAYQANQFLELGLLGLIGLVAGLLSDRERSLRLEAEAAAAERDRALKDLQDTVETLRQADRLAALGTMAATMAHEIRNPLGAMGGALEILDHDYPAGHPHREFVEILGEEVERLRLVSGKYLDYTRPQPREPRPLDVNAAVLSALDLLRKTAARGSVRFESRLAADLPPAFADPVQVHQVLVNLLLNGIQAMPEGGCLEVATASSGRGIRVTVRDHGPGLPGGSVDKLFEPFFSTKAGGTGLGLAVARRIATGHGGGLTARNAEDGGAVFDLELPAAPTGGAP